MPRPASPPPLEAPPHITDPEPAEKTRRRYESVLAQAMSLAQRYLPRDQALEIAHDVGSEMLRRPADRVTGTLVYIAVTNRLRRFSRSAQRRSAVENAYHESWSTGTPAWVQPGAEMEIRELQRRVATTIAAMPPGMRDVFVLIREEGLSYKDAAARLGVGVGTVHTQLSRASALLRECIAQYQSGGDTSTKGRQP